MNPGIPAALQHTTVLSENGGITTVETTVRYDTKEARDGVLQSPMESGVGASYDRLGEAH